MKIKVSILVFFIVQFLNEEEEGFDVGLYGESKPPMIFFWLR